MPSIAVNKNGVIGVTWYEFEKVHAGGYQSRFSASFDGGETWLPSVRVSSYAHVIKSLPEFAAQPTVRGGGRRRETSDRQRSNKIEVWVWPSPRSYYSWNDWPGDYAGSIVAAPDGAFQTFWISNQSSVDELYTARITVQGNASVPGGKELAGLENVSSALELQYISSVWNPRKKTLSLEYQFLNTSSDTINSPLKVRIMQLESDLGVPTLVSTNGVYGHAGTVLDLSTVIPSGGLAPGQTTSSKKLSVKFAKVNQLGGIEGRDVLIEGRDVLHMKIIVYGLRRIAVRGL